MREVACRCIPSDSSSHRPAGGQDKRTAHRAMAKAEKLRDFAARPKSTSQTSPLFSTGIFFFHRVEDARPRLPPDRRRAHLHFRPPTQGAFAAQPSALLPSASATLRECPSRSQKYSHRAGESLLAQLIRKMGYKNVLNIASGFKAWKTAGMATMK